MVAMDPDTEFNALSALYQSVVHDMKGSYTAWETVSVKATKLSAQLRQTADALSAFNQAVQGVSDLANNLKGASRDAGACVTRLCMRQRTVDSRLRGMADALADELAVSLKQRAAYWKARTADLDKAETKYVHKIRGRKGRPDGGSVAEQRALCKELLLEQRAQFAFFVNALMPVLKAEVSLMEEGLHIRPVSDSLDATLKHVNADTLVHTILADLTQGAENAWRSCLSSAGVASSMSCSSEEDCRSSSADFASNGSGPVDLDVTPQARPVYERVVSGAAAAGSRMALSHGRLSSSASSSLPPHSSATPSTLSSSPTEFAAHTPQGGSALHAPSLSSFRPSASSSYSIAQPDSRLQRPQSFAGDFRPNFPPQTAAYANGYGVQEGYGGGGGQPSSCSSSDNASLAETLQQIEQLAPNLENYCASGLTTSSSSSGGRPTTEYAVVDRGNAVRVRAESSSRPPPPERRSSTITAATPSAPSVAEARLSLASSSLRGSRQSLSSNHSSSAPFPCPPPSSFHPQAGYRTPSHYGNVNVNPYAVPRPPQYS